MSVLKESHGSAARVARLRNRVPRGPRICIATLTSVVSLAVAAAVVIVVAVAAAPQERAMNAPESAKATSVPISVNGLCEYICVRSMLNCD